MTALTIFAILVVLTIIGVFIWQVTRVTKQSDPGIVRLIDGSMSGKTKRTAPGSFPRSFNQVQGATFTYTGWILINDFTLNYGQRRVIFTKGDCPGVYLDSTSNSLLIVIDTYGSKESILISNMPAKKWIHLAIVVDQDAVDVYINGVIRQHHTLARLPKQNDMDIVLGSDTLGWDGVLSGLSYVSRSLTASDIDALSKMVPTDDLNVAPAGPQYFDMSWYTGRGV
jgi:hypothetical protein